MQTIGEVICQAALNFDSIIHPKEKSINEVKLPIAIKAIVEEDTYYQNHELIVEDLKAVYNAGVRDSIQRLKDEYSFRPEPTPWILHMNKILDELLIDM